MGNYEKLKNKCDDDLPHNVSMKTIHEYKTEYNADSVEWCPIKGFENIFVCGNYQLKTGLGELGTKHRQGRILLFSLDIKEGLKLEEEIETSAVLDQKWCHHLVNEKILLGVANSNAEIELYELKLNENKVHKLNKLSSFIFPCEEEELLVLSLDWSTNKYNTDKHEIICSDSRGSVHILKLSEDNLVLKKSVIKFHEFETWIAAFYYWDSNIYFSGGDDCILYKYDQRVGTEPVSRNRSHEAGVTSLHSNKGKENVIVSGSYDEHVRIWDLRNFRSPLSAIPTPGPVWRVKWDPFSQHYILVASMLGGAHILSATDMTHPKFADSFYEHENIVYGVDWSFMDEQETRKYPIEGNVIVASCSFYDNLLCVSKVRCDI